jgi:hypothetical protein
VPALGTTGSTAPLQIVAPGPEEVMTGPAGQFDVTVSYTGVMSVQVEILAQSDYGTVSNGSSQNPGPNGSPQNPGAIYSNVIPLPDVSGTIEIADAIAKIGSIGTPNAAQVFSIHSALVTAEQYVASALGATLNPTTGFYPNSNSSANPIINTVNVYYNNTSGTFTTNASSTNASVGINIIPSEAFNWDIVDHEYGHWVEDHFGFNAASHGIESPLGTHNQ